MNAIAINDRQQFPKYIIGYDTAEAAEAASNLAGGTSVVFAPDSTTTSIGGPGTILRAVTLIPDSASNGPVYLEVNGDSLLLWAGGATPLARVCLTLGVSQNTEANLSVTTGGNVSAIVTGYFTPTV